MKLSVTRAAAAVTLTAAAVFAAPLAANAYSTDPGPGETVSQASPANVATPGTTASVLLSGEDARFATVAVVQAVYDSNAPIGDTAPAGADGSVAYSIVLPSTATGSYSVTLVTDLYPGGFAMPAITPGGGGSGTAVGNSSGTVGSAALPATGMDSGSLLGLWVGGGALVLAGGAVAVGTAVHRQRKNADA